MRKQYILLIIFILWPGFAFGETYFLGGNALYEKCNAEAGTFNSIFCAAYIAGIADLFQLTKVACIPSNVVAGQVEDVVVKYLREHPESRHYSAASEAGLALRAAFPCGQ